MPDAQLTIFGGSEDLIPEPAPAEKIDVSPADQLALFGVCQDGRTIAQQGELID